MYIRIEPSNIPFGSSDWWGAGIVIGLIVLIVGLVLINTNTQGEPEKRSKPQIWLGLFLVFVGSPVAILCGIWSFEVFLTAIILLGIGVAGWGIFRVLRTVKNVIVDGIHALAS